MNWWATISNFWDKKVQTSKLGTLIAAGVIALVSLVIAAQSSLIRLGNIDSGLIGELFLGICIFIGGVLLFGFTRMRLTLTRLSLQRMRIISIFLLATVFLNVFGAPIALIELARLDFIRVFVTGFWEEMVFRGFLFAVWGKLFGLRSSISVLLLLLMSSFLFGISHPNQGVELFIRSSLGFLLGIVTLHTKTILFAILLHALHNGLTMMIVYRSSASPSLQVIALFILCMVGLSIILKHPNRDHQPYILTHET
ncbi:MAG: CPBP family intramembrane metalloprotease [Anaerolineae bacterium]|nr:CPBP family intramembrane metalloprotease [Anaerolineae bacterium]